VRCNGLNDITVGGGFWRFLVCVRVLSTNAYTHNLSEGRLVFFVQANILREVACASLAARARAVTFVVGRRVTRRYAPSSLSSQIAYNKQRPERSS
jgi:hypothetical protein